MRTKEITVVVKRTISTAPYESCVVELSETVALDAEDDAQEVRHETYASVTKMVKLAIDNEAKKYKTEKK